MTRLTCAFVAFLGIGVSGFAQSEPNPPVIAQMEELGTVYVTRRPAKAKTKDAPKTNKTVIVGVDFRPTMGSDPAKVADAVKKLATLPDLESVLLLGRDVTDAAADAIPASDKIINIRFFNTKITDKGVANLARLKNLRGFNFTGMGLTDVGLKELAKIKTLEQISITDAKVTDEGVMALQTLLKLRRLDIENSAATQRAIERLREKLPRLIDGERTLR